MMTHENDKLEIPKKYMTMSVPDLIAEKERVYLEYKSNETENKKIKKTKPKNVSFNL